MASAHTLSIPPNKDLEKNQLALRTDDILPIDTDTARDQENKRVYQGLISAHQRNVVEGYLQSHPLDFMYTSKDLAVDQWELSNNYMGLIFGGKPDPNGDNIHLAYNHATKQKAEAATANTKTLDELNPLSFVEGKPATKDSLLETFAESRRYFKGRIDSDTERMMKQRPTHDVIHTTFYGKNIGRYHHITGQHGHLQYRPDTSNFTPYENLSSRTYAPMGNGKEVPLKYEYVYNDDPRRVPVTNDPKVAVPEPVGSMNFRDAGLYPGREVDRYKFDYVEENPGFAAQFSVAGQRRWA